MKPYKERTYPSKFDPYKAYIHTRLSQALPDRTPSGDMKEKYRSYKVICHSDTFLDCT